MSAITIDRPTTAPDAGSAGPVGPADRALRWTGGVLGVAMILWSGVQGAELLALSTDVEEHVVAAEPVVELVADGDVAVMVDDDDDDEVTVLARSRTGFTGTQYSSDAVGGRLVISHHCRSWWSSSCDASLEVTVPAGTRLVVRSSSGSIGASGPSGDVDLSAQDGEILVQDIGGDVVAVARAGSVEVRGAAHDVEARTSDGAVHVTDVRGDVVARSLSGSVEVAGVRGDVEATTSDGRVTVRGAGEPVALDIETFDGEETIEAPTDPSAQRTVYIRSGSGDVSYLDAE